MKSKRRLLAIIIPCLIGWAFSYLAINVFRDYALGLFVWLPIIIGAISTMIAGYKISTQKKILRNTAFITLLIFCLGLLLFAWEGIICMLMAAPIGFFFTWLGYKIGYAIIKSKVNAVPTVIICLIISCPCLMSFEHSIKREDEIRSVTTSVEINTTPEKVWKNVITFSELKPPKEFIFKTGIAYPINATIDGTGVGAVRHCNFSTGSFTEPIIIWKEPMLLRFSVAEQPATMKELSIYNIHPNHIHGYWVSTQGQFKLIPLTNGHTLLKGTTWYINKIKPDLYWTLWSDYIVHKIHNRVLQHIKEQSEQKVNYIPVLM